MRDIVDAQTVDQHANAIVFVCDVGMAINPERQYAGEFHAHGPAVINGRMCTAGRFEGRFVENLDGYFDFAVRHKLACASGDGDFVITMRVKMYQPMHTYFEWELSEGTGQHQGLTGHGSGVGTATRMGRDVIRDHLFGHLEPAGA